MGNFSRDVKTVKKNQMEILELKMIIFKIINSLAGINRSLAITEESINLRTNQYNNSN